MSVSKERLDALSNAVLVLTNAVKVAAEERADSPAQKMAASDVAVLMFVGATPACRITDVAEHLRIGVTTASSIVDRLARKAVVKRARSEEDRRIVQLFLTSEGAGLYQDLMAEHVALCREMLHCLTPHEQDAFVDAMQKIAAHFRDRS